MAQHIPISRVRLIRYFGLYSSKSRGKWGDWNHVIKHSPEGWKAQYEMGSQEEADEFDGSCDIDALLHKKSKASWARLIQKIYEVDPMVCPECFSELKVIAIITSEYEVISSQLQFVGKRYCVTPASRRGRLCENRKEPAWHSRRWLISTTASKYLYARYGDRSVLAEKRIRMVFPVSRYYSKRLAQSVVISQ